MELYYGSSLREYTHGGVVLKIRVGFIEADTVCCNYRKECWKNENRKPFFAQSLGFVIRVNNALPRRIHSLTRRDIGNMPSKSIRTEFCMLPGIVGWLERSLFTVRLIRHARSRQLLTIPARVHRVLFPPVRMRPSDIRLQRGRLRVPH